jgi:cephalosporin hydroxylase
MPESDADFEKRKRTDVAAMASDEEFRSLSREWIAQSVKHRYSYNFRWLGLPIIQYPADIIAMQELIWCVRPSAIVETGVARGGSLVFYASMLALLGGDGIVVGIEVALTDETRSAIHAHPLSSRIRLVDGSSVAVETVEKVREIVAGRGPILVVLDSNHTHEHVLDELRHYSPLVGKDSYIVLFDTVVDMLSVETMGSRPWQHGNSPLSALRAFLAENDRFEVDDSFDKRLLLSVCPEGFLRCVCDYLEPVSYPGNGRVDAAHNLD